MFKNYAVTAWETNNYNQILPGKQLVKLRLKKETLAQVFSCEFSWEYLFLQNTSRGCFSELLIAKFKAYGLSPPALRFIHDYLPNYTAQKWSFPLRISSVNVPAGTCGFWHIYWRNPWLKTLFFVQCRKQRTKN